MIKSMKDDDEFKISDSLDLEDDSTAQNATDSV